MSKSAWEYTSCDASVDPMHLRELETRLRSITFQLAEIYCIKPEEVFPKVEAECRQR